MKSKFTLLVSLLLAISAFKSFGQKVSDILKNGIEVKESERIFIIGATSTFQFGKSVGLPQNYLPLPDSSIFLIHNKNGVNVYLQPLNPLKYAYGSKTTFIPDPINAAAENAFNSIIPLLKSLSPPVLSNAPNNAMESHQAVETTRLSSFSDEQNIYNKINNSIDPIKVLLEKDLKDKINNVFNKLRDSISFVSLKPTYSSLDSVNNLVKDFNNYYNIINLKIKTLSDDIKSYSNISNSAINKFVFNQILIYLQSSFDEKYTRLKNLQNAYNLVKEAADNASKSTPTSVEWFGEPINVTIPADKIAILTITLNNSGYELKDGEIVKSASSVKATKVLRFRKFQQFIPEVSAGIAYASLSFPKYGITTDASGKNTVSSAGSDDFKKLNFTAMINFVYYTKNPLITWFYQLGVGAKTDYPTLLTGLGLRFEIFGKTLALSTGAASTWVKSPTNYKIGDTVTDAKTLENDLTYQFQMPKLYFGIQYNF